MIQQDTEWHTENITKTLRIIAHPLRLSILRFLIQSQGAYVYEIIDYTKTSQSIVSQHLTKLRDLSIVKDERHGIRIFYSVEDNFVKEIMQLVSKYA